jgi:hypothetical protein
MLWLGAYAVGALQACDLIEKTPKKNRPIAGPNILVSTDIAAAYPI